MAWLVRIDFDVSENVDDFLIRACEQIDPGPWTGNRDPFLVASADGRRVSLGTWRVNKIAQIEAWVAEQKGVRNVAPVMAEYF